MTKAELIQTAQQLKQVGEEIASEYAKNAENMTLLMNGIMQERSDINELVGEINLGMMKDNHANHARFIASILRNHNSEVLVDTVLWVFRAYRSRGFASSYWAAQLNAWIEILKEKLSTEAYHQVLPLYEWMQINIPTFVKLSDEKLELPGAIH
jgi:hypothetical protein